MEDEEAYGCLAILSNHTAWLQHLEQSQAKIRGNEAETTPSPRLALQVMPPAKASSASLQASRKRPVINKVQGEVDPFSEPSQQGDNICAAFNSGTCVNNASHPSELHMCSYCLYTVQQLCHHAEQYCRCKGMSKYGAWGV